MMKITTSEIPANKASLSVKVKSNWPEYSPKFFHQNKKKPQLNVIVIKLEKISLPFMAFAINRWG